MSESDLINKAINHALNDEWNDAHEIVQNLNSEIACWIHATLHKIEGDSSNSRYWYARTRHQYEEFSDPVDELLHIKTMHS
ncbi:MAG: hypothetical protein VW238_05035 [Nitrosomonadales bacterium]|jgi:hypothetical protein